MFAFILFVGVEIAKDSTKYNKNSTQVFNKCTKGNFMQLLMNKNTKEKQ